MITVYFDFETGGVEPTHPSIQLAAVAWDGGVELGTFEQKIAFDESKADPAALAMNHYDRALWTETAVSPQLTAAKFDAWLRPYRAVTLTSKRTNRPYTVARLAGYNAIAFDAPRLRELFGAQFLPGDYPVRDVLQRAVFYFDDHTDVMRPENMNLATVCAHFGISAEGAHDALTDARLCAELDARIKAEAAQRRV